MNQPPPSKLICELDGCEVLKEIDARFLETMEPTCRVIFINTGHPINVPLYQKWVTKIPGNSEPKWVKVPGTMAKWKAQT